MKIFAMSTRKQAGTPRRPALRMARTPETARVVQRAEIRHILRGPQLQTKLTVGAPNDAYEREADRVADAVMRMPEPDERIRRVCPECEEELQRQPAEEEEEELQRQPAEEEEEEVLAAKAMPGEVPEIDRGLEARIQALRGGGRTLPESERTFFEPRFGADFGAVRIHDDNRSAQLARAVNARAFTVGRDVVFGRGEHRPGTAGGRSLVAHELTHVIQQEGDSRSRRSA